MSRDVEEELRHRMHAGVAGFELAPGAITTAVEQGRRRVRRRKSIAGGGMALAVVATGLTAGVVWDTASDPVVVTTDAQAPADGQPPAPRSDEAAQQPGLITRNADEPSVALFAAISGTLVVTPDNCIAVAAPEEGDGYTVVVWRHGWSSGLQDGKAVLYDADGTVVKREGEPIRVGGGGMDRTWASWYRPHRCWTDNMFAAND